MYIEKRKHLTKPKQKIIIEAKKQGEGKYV